MKNIPITFYCLTFFLLVMSGCSDSKKSSTITIGIVGDIMLGRMTNQVMNAKGARYIWGNLSDLLYTTDLNLGNLETTFTISTSAIPKVFNFKADPKNVRALQEAQFDVVNTANNHILDFDIQGLQETVQTLDAANILHTGAGMNIEQAQKPVIITKNDIRIGIIGFTDNEPTWQAAAAKPGTNYISVDSPQPAIEQIKKLRPKVDLLILSIHWGPNMRQHPTPEFKSFAHAMIDAGVDIFHGHSAHIFQGIEIYKKRPILYDTGDFIDDYAIDEKLRNDQTFFFKIFINKENNKIHITHIELFPCLINNVQVNHAVGDERMAIIKKMRMLCQEMDTLLNSDNKIIII